ncbi:Dot1 [Kluyveromyces lactis]|nr:Dot1 [Kluyveromyces lactis]
MSTEATGSDASVFSNMHSVDNTRDNTRDSTPMNESDTQGKRMTKSTMALIEESMKYDMRSEYFLPMTFLRERRKPAKVESDEEDKLAEVKPKRRVSKKNQVKTDIHSTKIKKTGRFSNAKAGAKNTSKVTKQRSIKSQVSGKKGSKSISDGKVSSIDANRDLKTSKKKRSSHVDYLFLSNIEENVNHRPSFFNMTLIRNPSSFTNKLTSSKIFVEDEEVTSLKGMKYMLFPGVEEEYLIRSKVQKFGYNPLLEIGQSIESAVLLYFPNTYKTKGQALVRSLNDAFERSDDQSFEKIVLKYNDLISAIPRNLIVENLSSNPDVPVSFVHFLLHTCYTRAIYPHARKLKKYTSFSNFVYGELMPDFLTMVFKKCGLNSNSIFMDLGSGVGNCVIQASLEFGCKLSFGCEIMDSASDMAELQLKELKSRCDLWGINLPPIDFSLRKSFVDNERVHELIPQCDVILINNFIFDAPLNKEVEKIVQGLKPGSKIISLKSIRPAGYSINYDDMDNIFNRLHVESFKLPENSVSWTYRSVGDYYISTVLDAIDESIFCPPILGRIRKKESIKYTR